MANATPEPNKNRRTLAAKLTETSADAINRGVVIISDDPEYGGLISGLVKATLGASPARLEYDNADDLVILRPDVVLLVADGGGRWRRVAREFEGEFTMALAAEAPTVDEAAEAMRCGLVDLLLLDSSERALARSVTELLKRTNAKATNSAPPPLALVPSDMSQALGGDMDLVTVRAEFGVLARLELDVESLLRTTLEYVLHKIGPTNAAVFLPTSGQDFTLGAYVNYDCPRDCVDMLLDHVAASVAPAIEADPSMRLHRGEDALDELMGEHAAWLTGCEAVTFAAEHEDEMLAAVALFRDDRDPFDVRTMQRLGVISDILAQQLARIIRVHHRHVPIDQWDGSDEQSEDPPMAA